MNKKTGSLSMAILFSCAILSKYLIILPEYMVKYVGNSAWIDATAKCIIASISLTIVLILYKPFAPQSFSEVLRIACGKVGSVFFSYIYIVLFTLFNAFLLRLLIEALSTVMATVAPDEFFAIFILAAVFVAAYSGIKATTNLSCIIFPLVVLTLITVCLALIPHYRTDNIMPIFGISEKRLLHGIFVKHFGFSETALLFFLAPALGSYKSVKRTGIITYVIITLFTVAFTAAYCLTVPYPASETFFLPFYQMTRMIKSGAFLQRLEPISVFVWTSFIMCSMSVLISAVAKLLSHSTDEYKEKSFVPAVTLITFFIAMLPKSETTAFYFYEKLLSTSTLLFPTIPVIVLIIARIRQRRKRNI